MSQFFEVQCSKEDADRVMTVEITGAGDARFHNFDPETELAAIELGFQPDVCFHIWAFLQPLWDNSQLISATDLLLQIVDEEVFDPDLDLSLRDKRALFQASIADMLIALGADPNAVNDEGETALALAANYRFHDAVKSLLAAGADPSAEDSLAVRAATVKAGIPLESEKARIEQAIENAYDEGYPGIAQLIEDHYDYRV